MAYDELLRLEKKLYQSTGLKLHIEAESEADIKSAAAAAKKLLNAYNEKYSLPHMFGKAVNNELSFDELESCSAPLKLSESSPSVLFLIRSRSVIEQYAVEIIKGLFPENELIIRPDSHNILMLYSAAGGCEENAALIADALNTEAMLAINIAYSRDIHSAAELPQCYQNCILAMNIGRIFYPGQLIIPYNRLGIGRLLYSAPRELCEAYLRECFRGNTFIELDEEAHNTINTFFKNNLNIAETARQLHMHRNTLVYRLEQLEKLTGLEIRSFEGAMSFKLAYMILNYLNNSHTTV